MAYSYKQPPHTLPKWNTERLNRTLTEHARAMIKAHNVPHFLWPEAIMYATYLKNRSPTRAIKDDKTPYGLQAISQILRIYRNSETNIGYRDSQQDQKRSKLNPKC